MDAEQHSEEAFHLDTDELPHAKLVEVRLALDSAAYLYRGKGCITIDAALLRTMLDTLEDFAAAEDGLDNEREDLADKKAALIRKVLEEHQAKYPRTDAVSESQADAVKELCAAVDNLLNDL